MQSIRYEHAGYNTVEPFRLSIDPATERLYSIIESFTNEHDWLYATCQGNVCHLDLTLEHIRTEYILNRRCFVGVCPSHMGSYTIRSAETQGSSTMHIPTEVPTKDGETPSIAVHNCTIIPVFPYSRDTEDDPWQENWSLIDAELFPQFASHDTGDWRGH